MTLLGEGRLVVRTPAAGARHFRVRGGFLQVVDDVVRVIADRAETE
jgi:F0F1-type ATP synthase epsilon subunit